MAMLALASLCLTPIWTTLRPTRKQTSTLPRSPRVAAMLLAAGACVCLHCAFVSPEGVAPWLHRSALAMAAVTWMAALYGLLMPRVLPAESVWSRLGQRIGTGLGLVACGLLAALLIGELYDFDPNLEKTLLVPAVALVVTLALGALIASALIVALSDERGQFQFGQGLRRLYVYGAEALLMLATFHLRMSVPELFGWITGQYWVLIVMAIAFLGVALSSLCERRGLSVLADPLQRTAMFLPVLPLLAFLVQPLWANPAALRGAFHLYPFFAHLLDNLPSDFRWHAAVWFTMGLLYLVVALKQRSSNLALTAAVIANFGLWVLFVHHEQLAFLLHPQIWLMPIGIVVLAAEHLNRERLDASQQLALRYIGLLTIYISSSADMFIAGIGNSQLYPVLLAVLAVAGVMLGIMLQVRAFLVLGVTFLFLVVFSEIWHAAVDLGNTWVWWMSGIVLGGMILAFFAWFEKRRNDVVKLIDDIKQWR
jgi:hypothetical protein